MPLLKAAYKYPKIQGLVLEHISGIGEGRQFRRVACYWIQHMSERFLSLPKPVPHAKEAPIMPEDLVDADRKHEGHFSFHGYDRGIMTIV